MARELPEGFPDLFGCRRHRPASVETFPWSHRLVDENWNRSTLASGIGWTLSLDITEDEQYLMIVDCTWAANALREMGVDLASAPLVAVQHWGNRSDIEAIDGCSACEERLTQFDRALIHHLSDGMEEDATSSMPRFPRLKWSDSPADIAAAVMADLRARSIVGEAMTVLEATAGWDLVPKAPVYVQFRLGLEGELQIQARKDFLYWDTVVDDARCDVFSAAGFSVDDPHYFEMLLGPDPHDLTHRDAVEAAVRATVTVFEPKRNRIRVERFEGVSHIEGERSELEYSTGQRRIDRASWADLFEAADGRLDDQGDDIRLFDLLDEQRPEFAELIALAHLDEYFERMDDLHVLVPIDAEVILADAESDPFTSPEDLAAFVLRHCFRWSEQRARAVAGEEEEVDPNVLVIETVAHESFVARLKDGELAEIGGFPIERVADSSCVNGSFSILHGRLEPPAPPPLVVPKFG